MVSRDYTIFAPVVASLYDNQGRGGAPLSCWVSFVHSILLLHKSLVGYWMTLAFVHHVSVQASRSLEVRQATTAVTR